MTISPCMCQPLSAKKRPRGQLGERVHVVLERWASRLERPAGGSGVEGWCGGDRSTRKTPLVGRAPWCEWETSCRSETGRHGRCVRGTPVSTLGETRVRTGIAPSYLSPGHQWAKDLSALIDVQETFQFLKKILSGNKTNEHNALGFYCKRVQPFLNCRKIRHPGEDAGAWRAGSSKPSIWVKKGRSHSVRIPKSPLMLRQTL
jgi:hypothetical protein